jgi:hypothetical protein
MYQTHEFKLSIQTNIDNLMHAIDAGYAISNIIPVNNVKPRVDNNGVMYACALIAALMKDKLLLPPWLHQSIGATILHVVTRYSVPWWFVRGFIDGFDNRSIYNHDDCWIFDGKYVWIIRGELYMESDDAMYQPMDQGTYRLGYKYGQEKCQQYIKPKEKNDGTDKRDASVS